MLNNQRVYTVDIARCFRKVLIHISFWYEMCGWKIFVFFMQ